MYSYNKSQRDALFLIFSFTYDMFYIVTTMYIQELTYNIF